MYKKGTILHESGTTISRKNKDVSLMSRRQGGFNQIVRPNQTSSAILGRFFDTASRKITISKDREYESKPKPIKTGIPKAPAIYDLTGSEDLIFQGPQEKVVIKQEEQEEQEKAGNTDELKDNELGDTGLDDLTTEDVGAAVNEEEEDLEALFEKQRHIFGEEVVEAAKKKKRE
ncbi:hypothetical protein RFI_24497 [Reticulomyxa filosa]|uniref:Uncharacterized protein n=1 Tax=Reticulomyxa filosa TaxID=46433 RepID=X6MHK9_RETFI|nr:hypothetical protein RFI_24497 [Reticulomyxa filosa]|eukprot:ETO12877.1 hypothetical protein RFI_24497 [Reticulomyxa filosa]